MLGALLLAPFRELGRFFFALNSGLALVLLGLGLPFRTPPQIGGPEFGGGGSGLESAASSAAILAMISIVAYITVLYLPGERAGKPALALATLSCLAATALDGWSAGRGGENAWIFGASSVAAAALLGSVIVAMILGHWYLVRSHLSVAHLVRFSLILAAAIALRTVLMLGGLLIYGASSPSGVAGLLRDLAVGRGFFFWQRIGFGLVGPAVFAYMIHATASIRSTQSATGILYLAVVFVLIGEFIARYLSVAGVGPL
jgi:hypothetical protein